MNSRKIYHHAGTDAVHATATAELTFSYIRHSILLFAFALIMIVAPAAARAQVTPAATPTPIDYGMVTGGIYSKLSTPGPIRHPLLDYADQIFAEYKGLGVKWIRIEAKWPNNFDPQYTFLVDKAHAYGLKVVVLLTRGSGNLKPYCQWYKDQQRSQQTVDRDPWLNDYVAELDRLATKVFFNSDKIKAQADAYEIMNEPNQFNNLECTDTGLFRMDGDSFGWLLRFVRRWKKRYSRPEKIISGGTINTFTNEPWWPAFFSSGAFFSAPDGSERPFDYFGVHPYNDGNTPDDIRKSLIKVSDRLKDIPGGAGTRIFVTEYGAATAQRMNLVVPAIRDSGVVDAIFWYDYRDDHPGGYGLREVWSESLQRYPAKTSVENPMWKNFKTLAGGKGDDDPESYWTWNRLPYGALDPPLNGSIGGWAYDPDTVDPVDVYLFIGPTQVATMKADKQRFDLIDAGVAPNAAHGYTFQLPPLTECRDAKVLAQNSRGGPLVQIGQVQQVCPR